MQGELIIILPVYRSGWHEASAGVKTSLNYSSSTAGKNDWTTIMPLYLIPKQDDFNGIVY